ncbi:NACHT domain protein [Fusarium subglutinans]|uniref:NACHT domain protein n=1 Tax=Gibberella subglutinans TaxID=42677 RepID=A0A8H5Q2E3_GIBSU|nr:NACHT domain protein [Fusarium subglutinans]KAF5606336.1 NACHT domain protein [Fusarium subglutinans]
MDLAQSSQAVSSAIPKKGDRILQNAIDSFRTVLTPEQLAEFENIQSIPDTDAVLVFTAELDLRRQNQRGKSIASRLFPVLQAVHSFTSVIDTFVSSNPTIAALVWGSVKMTMTIMLNVASYYEAFVELCIELGRICPRFEQYQALFPASERLQNALCTFNASIIQCCQRVIAMPKRSSGWTSPLNPLNPSFWQSFQQVFEADLQKLRDNSNNVNKEIRLAADQSQHRNNELQRLENEQADRSRRSLSRFMSRTRDDFDRMHRLQIMKQEELENCLSSYDYIKPLKQARQKRYPKSAKWIFSTNQFKRWSDGTTSGLLWCSGKMGSGKSIICLIPRPSGYTLLAAFLLAMPLLEAFFSAKRENPHLKEDVFFHLCTKESFVTAPMWVWMLFSGDFSGGSSTLCASVIDYLLTERSDPQSHVTFFFSRFDDLESMRAETILRALVRQLVTVQDVSGRTKQVLETIRNASGDILSELSRLLTHLLSRKGPPSWVVVDGIDECQREERQVLMKVWRSMLDDGANVRLFITSRDHTSSIFKGASVKIQQISMNCSLAQDGMAQLVDQAVQKSLDSEELLVSDQTLISEIKNTLAKHADGMHVSHILLQTVEANSCRILWVTLILRHLCSQPNNEKIREAIALRNLPKNLTGIFDRILDRMISDEKDSIVQALLPWIVAAKQPLTLSQLEECCLISPLQEYTIRDRYVNRIHLIDTWFQGLIEIDYETKTVHFIHACVQQFFLTAPDRQALSNFHVCIQDADRHIGDICVTYLNFSDFKTTLARVRPPLPPIAPDEICQQALSNEWSWPRFLRLSQRIHGHKRLAANIDTTIASCTRAPDATGQETIILNHPFLAYASAYWLSHSVDFDQEHCQTWSLWKNMLIFGHELASSPVSEEHHRTIDKGLVLWATQNRHSALLHVLASSTELIEEYQRALLSYVMKESDLKLLRRMLNTNIPTWELYSLCCRAAHDGHLEIIKALCEEEVNINEYGSLSKNGHIKASLPLLEAVEKGHIKVVEYLLQKGANPNSPAGLYQSALEPAAELGGLKGLQACRLLIDAGANARNTDILLRSCARGDKEIIKLLLSAGADVNASYLAPGWKLLSEEGAFIYQENTALLEAFSVAEPDVDVIELLIGAGARINIGSPQDSGYRLLREAIRSRNCHLVRILIREGANPNGRPGLHCDDTPLTLAAIEGSFEIIGYLLRKGARVIDLDLTTTRIPGDLKNGKNYEELLAALRQADRQ